MRSIALALLAATLLPMTACNLYFSGGDDVDCTYPASPGEGAPQIPEQLRNPQSGQCEDFGWTNPPPPPVNPCNGGDWGGSPPSTTAGGSTEPDTGSGADRAGTAMPSWGYCQSYCTGLDEAGCLATDGCRGIYSAFGEGAQDVFQECWQKDFNDVAVSDCEGLDPYTCSQSDACVAVHEFDCYGATPDGLVEQPCTPGAFVSCHNEPQAAPGCYTDAECDAGSTCNAFEICLPPPSGNGDACVGCQVPVACYGYCVPSVDPGECDGPLGCLVDPPICPDGTTPGIANGCWTGSCIDLSECPATACADIAGEAMCIARSDCSPFYAGVDCSCTPDGCDCSDWSYDSCSDAQ